MNEDDGPPVVVEVAANGTRLFNGQTAEQRVLALDRPKYEIAIDGRRTAKGEIAAGKRQGRWLFVSGRETIEVEFVDDAAVDPPDGWTETEWPRGTTQEQHRLRVERVALVLRELRGKADVLRVWNLVKQLCKHGERSGEAFEDALGLSSGDVSELWSRLAG